MMGCWGLRWQGQTAKGNLLALPFPSFILGYVGDPQGRQIMYQNCLGDPVVRWDSGIDSPSSTLSVCVAQLLWHCPVNK